MLITMCSLSSSVFRLLYMHMNQASVVQVQHLLMLQGTCKLLLTLPASDHSNIVCVVVDQ